jgi:uncharacterized protein YydD (DUF2326 family)
MVKSILHHHTIAPHLNAMISIIREIASTKVIRLKLRAAAKAASLPVNLIKPNTTRWNSTLIAVTRFIKCKELLTPLKATLADGKKMTDLFWTILTTLVSFLQPFQLATDLVQQDAASMNTFYCAFITVRNRCIEVYNDNNHALNSVAKTAIDVINNHWTKYISNDLYTITKLLLKDEVASLDVSDIKPAQRWFFNWSLLYFRGMNLFADDDDDF